MDNLYYSKPKKERKKSQMKIVSFRIKIIKKKIKNFTFTPERASPRIK